MRKKKKRKKICPFHYTWKFLAWSWETKNEIFIALNIFTSLSLLVHVQTPTPGPARPRSDSPSHHPIKCPTATSTHRRQSPRIVFYQLLKKLFHDKLYSVSFKVLFNLILMHLTKLWCHIIKITKNIVILKDNIKSFTADLCSTFSKLYLTQWMSVTGEAESGVANPSPMMSVPLGSAVCDSSLVTCSETAG